jgi:hypothetical protein
MVIRAAAQRIWGAKVAVGAQSRDMVFEVKR